MILLKKIRKTRKNNKTYKLKGGAAEALAQIQNTENVRLSKSLISKAGKTIQFNNVKK
jgi:hypothetical protein